MTDKNSSVDSELIATDDTQDSADGQDTELDLGEGDTEGTEADQDLNLEAASDTGKPTTAEVEAMKQENAWFAKIVAEKASLDDSPKWLQERLQKRLGSTEAPDIDTIVDKKVSALLERKEFEERQKSLGKILTPEQKKELPALFAQYKSLGLLKALDTSLALMGVKDDSRARARSNMSLPPSGQPRSPKSTDIVSIAKDPKAWKALVKGSN